MLSEEQIRVLRDHMRDRYGQVIMPGAKERIRNDIDLLNLILEED